MGKKSKLSAEERRKRREEREREAHEKWLEQFACFGIHSDDEVYELVFEKAKDLVGETVENGYHSDPPWRDGECGEEQEELRISEYEGKYIVWIRGECRSGEIWDPPLEEMVFLYDTLEEARDKLNSLPKGEPPLREQVMDCKEKLGDPAYWIKAESGGWPGQHNFAVFYDRDLIAENIRDLDNTAPIQEAVRRYKEFKKSLEERGVTLDNIDKPPREWNHNERYYEYEIEYKEHPFTLKAVISSRYQHAERETMDFFPEEKLQLFISEVDAGDPYPGLTKKEKEKKKKECEEYQAMCDAAYQGIEHGEGILPIALSEEQNRSLSSYLMAHAPFASCDGTLKNTVQWVVENIDEESRAGVLESIRNGGGYCDCEVMMNYFSEK